MTDALAFWLGERLLIGSLQGALIVSLVWLTCRLVPRMPAAAQSALWWLVALKLVLVFAPVPALPVPLLPADFQRLTERIFLQPLVHDDEPMLISGWQAADFAIVGNPGGVLTSPINSWFRALLVIWFVALLLQAGRLVLAHRHLRGIVRRSVPWEDAETGELAQRIGLTRTPPVRLSDEIDSPQVCGLWSPVVLVPTEAMTTLTAEERSMTLCHELMHIRRRDLAFGWIPACAERLFFFHPFARLSAREYVAAREAACDASAVRALGVSASDYGRMLVRLGLGNAMPGLAAGGSPFSASSLKRRLHMLEHHRPSNLSRRWRWVIAVIAAVVIPMQLVARTPAAQPVSGPSFDLYQLLVGLSAKLQGKEVAETQAPRKVVRLKKVVADDPQTVELGKLVVADEQQAVELEKLKIDKLKTKLEHELKNKEVRLSIGKLVERAEQERAGVDEQTDRANKLREQLAAQIAALAEAQKAQERAGVDQEARKTEQQRLAQTLAALAKLEAERAGAEQEARKTDEQQILAEYLRQREARGQQEVTQQFRQLAERLEQLAAEQRQLAEELQRLRKQTPAR